MQLNQACTTQVTFWVDKGGASVRKGTEGAEEVSFELRRLTGRDQRELTDLAHRVDKRGRPATSTGRVYFEKLARSVVKVSGLVDPAGNPIERFTLDVFDGLPGWMTDALLHEVNALNEFEEGE